MKQSSARDLLFGIIAFHMNLVQKEELVAAVSTWLSSKTRSLDDVLVEQGTLGEPERELLEPIVNSHLQHHGDDPQRCLATMSRLSSVVEELSSLGNPDLIATLSLAADDSATIDPAATLQHVSSGTPHAGTDRPATRFRIVRSHAKGGLGEVYLAQDTELNRQVALKEIQGRFADDEASRQRFLLEAEVTGGLEHPGIVPVYGLGRYADGRPFYAMRFIQGDSLKDAAERFHRAKGASGDAQRFDGLEFRSLMRRFVDVCNAIEYAHSRGILHRDLKPGNVMLGKYGETLVVDWGLAKSIERNEPRSSPHDQPLRPAADQGSLETQVGSVLGTPQFMSPEQAAGKLDELGPASDVYSLGATLYFLVTNQTPFSERNVQELLEQVRQGAFRQPREVNAAVPKPLEAICQKAMQRQAADRYATPTELAEDVERWLADERVLAYPEPWSMRAWRWIRHHRTQVAAVLTVGAIAMLSLFVVLAVVSASNRKLQQSNQMLDQANVNLKNANASEREAREEAEQNAKQLADALVEIEAKELEVRQERDVAVAINQFVREDLLGQASPEQQPDRDIKLRTVLDRSVRGIKRRFEEQPLVNAAISQTVADAYHDLGEYATAEPLLLAARELHLAHREPDDPEALSTHVSLAVLYQSQGRTSDAFELARETRETLQRVLGDAHPLSIRTSTLLASLYRDQSRYAEALKLGQANLEVAIRALGEDDPATLSAKNLVGTLLVSLGEYAQAEPLLKDTWQRQKQILGPEHPSTNASINNLAANYVYLDRFSEAEILFREALEVSLRVNGEDHPYTLSRLNNLAATLVYQGKYGEAEPTMKQLAEAYQRVLGDGHLDTISARTNLADVYLFQGRLDEAERIYVTALPLIKQHLGREHHTVLSCVNNLANIYFRQARYDKAEPLFVETIDTLKRVLGPQHPDLLSSMNNLAAVYQAQQKFEQAEPLYVETLAAQRKVLGPEHSLTLSTMAGLAGVYASLNRDQEAEKLLRETLELESKVLGAKHPNTLGSQLGLANFLYARTRFEEAKSMFQAWLELRGETTPNLEVADVRFHLGDLSLRQGEFEESEAHFRQAIAIREQQTPEHWLLADLDSRLGSALAGQGQYEQAETLMLGGLRTLQVALALGQLDDPSRLSGAFQRVVDLYRSWEKPDAADHWSDQGSAWEREWIQR